MANHNNKNLTKTNPQGVTTQQPQSQKGQVIKTIQQFTGPLPHPEILAHYNQITPDAANRIICMAEQQASHRQHIEKTMIETEAGLRRKGQWFGFTLGIIGLIGGIICILLDKPWGAAISGVSLVSLVSVFVFGRKKQKVAQVETPEKSI